MRLIAPLACCAALTACGGTVTPQPGPTTAASIASAAPTPPVRPTDAAGATASLPTRCADTSADLCTPPPDFVERLCGRPRQEAALILLAKSSPFTRLYLKGRVDELAFDEEVLALRFHAQNKGGMIVGSGNGTFDVLRWDGSCARGVEAEVLTRSRPPRPRTAHVQWHRVGERMQTALVAASDGIKRAHARRGKECKGAMTGDVSAACEKADAALVDAIVVHVRAATDLPEADAF